MIHDGSSLFYRTKLVSLETKNFYDKGKFPLVDIIQRNRHDAQKDIITEETALRLFFLLAIVRNNSKHTSKLSRNNSNLQWHYRHQYLPLKGSMLQLSCDHSGLRNISCSIGHKKPTTYHPNPQSHSRTANHTTIPYHAPAASSQLIVFSSHNIPAAASSHQPANSVFLSHHSSSSLQHQHSEQGENRYIQHKLL